MPSLRALFVLLFTAVSFASAAETLPGTQPLTAEGDLSVRMVDGIHRWLMRETERVDQSRKENWTNLTAVPENWKDVIARQGAALAKIIGAVDSRREGPMQIVSDAGLKPAAEIKKGYVVESVVWPVFDGVHGEGLLLRPVGRPVTAALIALPDADESPEECAGIQEGMPREMQFARRFAERGFLVLVPTLVNRRDDYSGSEALRRMINAPHREWIHRLSFESGRTLLGFEVQKVLAAVSALDALSHQMSDNAVAKMIGAEIGGGGSSAYIGVLGSGEGGVIALRAAALDSRIRAVFLHGSFGVPKSDEPIYRNIFGGRRMFTDAGLATLMAPRPLFVTVGGGPEIAGPPTTSGNRRVAAPGVLSALSAKDVEPALQEANTQRRQLGAPAVAVCSMQSKPTGNLRSPEEVMSAALSVKLPEVVNERLVRAPAEPSLQAERQRRTVRELEEFSQAILRDSERVRKALPIWTKLKPGAEWEAVQKQARADFWENGIGKMPGEYAAPNPRTRLVHDEEKWRGYEVMLDVQPDVFAWGTLLVPKDLRPGERRPVVVCQHGLEGLPEDTITTDESAPAWKYYKGFAARLCERGFIVYAPHNPYRGGDNFRRIQREANPLGLSLFSFIIAQHDVTTQWLASLPFVDAERIAFYGLSYGGKTAMRVPAVLGRYCLSICSGDFNEWVMKCASVTHPAGYVFSPEWEIWEWNLAHTFNYAEMALLIAPRPFMVERGHDDGVGLDEDVGHEFAKVRRGYDKLGISERAEIEWFDGPHTIHGVGTFQFLHKWLRWPEPR